MSSSLLPDSMQWDAMVTLGTAGEALARFGTAPLLQLL